MKYRVYLQLFCMSTALAHMSLWFPPPLGGAKEANSLTTHVDDKLNFPLGCCDADGAPSLSSPGDCRGHLDLLGTGEGAPQVTWEPGQDAHFQLSDHTYTSGAPGSTHYGGSCQVGFSVDKGQTWRAAASYHGNCPHRSEKDGQIFNFKVPVGIPSGPAVFAWIWLNREHESFMNCASVQIGQGSSNVTVRALSTKVSSSIKLPPTSAHRSYGEDKTRMSSIYDAPHRSSSGTWSVAKPTGSSQEYLSHGRSTRHPTYYFPRAIHRSKTLLQPSRLLSKRAVEICDWNSAPTMKTSYYTADARCAANAKTNKPESDDFEVGWSDACGIVEGDGQYPIKDIDC
ncbi:hypothetical protein EK21DRAFT_77794 [Setomelanomma holmii]|uniref:Lytic polysaccharide monooxygenase n=1 Tax=Setomelanomma holmii TaxID=210430 RepID=A0A9P4LHS1_9PLEO|nr:hypothetical protein EK21DRAFT_77794 [Setomelanomma holmii]